MKTYRLSINVIAIIFIFISYVLPQNSDSSKIYISSYQDSIDNEILKHEKSRNWWLIGSAALLASTVSLNILGNNSYDNYQNTKSAHDALHYWDQTKNYDKAFSYSFALTITSLISSYISQYKIGILNNLKQNIPVSSIYQICDSCYIEGRSILIDKEDNIFLVKNQTSDKSKISNFYFEHLNAEGQVNWETHFESDNYKKANNILLDMDNGFVILGQEKLKDNINLFVMKTDNNGKLLWEKSFDYAPNEKSFGIVSLVDSGYIISSNLRFDSSKNNISLIRIDRLGNRLWNNIYKQDLNIYGVEILKTGEMEIVLSGTVFFEDGKSNIISFAIKTNGKITWEKIMGSMETKSELNAVCLNNSGNIVLLYKEELSELIFTEIDPNGKILYEYKFEEMEIAVFNQILPLKDGGYAIVGSSSLKVTLIIINDKGIPQYRGDYKILDKNQEYSIVENSDGSLILAGTSKRVNSLSKVFILKTYSFINTAINQ